MIPEHQTRLYKAPPPKPKSRRPVWVLAAAAIVTACAVGALAFNHFANPGVEVVPGNDGNPNAADPKTVDTDRDGISDYNETNVFGTNSSMGPLPGRTCSPKVSQRQPRCFSRSV